VNVAVSDQKQLSAVSYQLSVKTIYQDIWKKAERRARWEAFEVRDEHERPEKQVDTES
jgi:hypothetical protein